MFEYMLHPGAMSLSDLRHIYEGPVQIRLEATAQDKITASRAVVDRVIKESRIVYGINTGFGKLADKAIAPDQLDQLQENLILSHCAGTGPALPEAVTRLMLALKINALAQGFSGVRPIIIDSLVTLLNRGVYPRIPAQGSVGASGDLAPLAHMAGVLLGVGEIVCGGKILSAEEGLKSAGLKPLRLAAKEGLALINGTQASTALALAALFETEKIFSGALVAGALSLDASRGSLAPFDARIHAVRRQCGQIEVADFMRDLLTGSTILKSHEHCGKVQDPYCLRCIPQVMGSCLDTTKHVADVLEREANAVTDNPLVFAEGGDVISGGNFHAEPVAFAADMLALALCEIGSLSERRIAMLTDSAQSGLPAFLVGEPGINSGFMIAHVTAAALTSENKQRAHPASVDSIPTSANQEDHVSMATHGARRLLDMAENAAVIVGVELLAAAQGVEFHRPLNTAPQLENVLAQIREKIPTYERDRYMAPDIKAAKQIVMSGAFVPLCKNLLPSH